MKPQCKAGEMAIVISSRNGNLGRVVRCLEPYTGPFFDVRTGQLREDLGLAWFIHPHLPTEDGRMTDAMPDMGLFPIRDPGPDATDSRDIKLGEAMRTQVREDARTPVLIGMGGES